MQKYSPRGFSNFNDADLRIPAIQPACLGWEGPAGGGLPSPAGPARLRLAAKLQTGLPVQYRTSTVPTAAAYRTVRVRAPTSTRRTSTTVRVLYSRGICDDRRIRTQQQGRRASNQQVPGLGDMSTRTARLLVLVVRLRLHFEMRRPADINSMRIVIVIVEDSTGIGIDAVYPSRRSSTVRRRHAHQ